MFGLLSDLNVATNPDNWNILICLMYFLAQAISNLKFEDQQRPRPHYRCPFGPFDPKIHASRNEVQAAHSGWLMSPEHNPNRDGPRARSL
jgi:hypothetical protein